MQKMEISDIGDEMQHTLVKMLLSIWLYAAIPKDLAATASFLSLKLLIAHSKFHFPILKQFKYIRYKLKRYIKLFG